MPDWSNAAVQCRNRAGQWSWIFRAARLPDTLTLFL
jgi:hypothetical protein